MHLKNNKCGLTMKEKELLKKYESVILKYFEGGVEGEFIGSRKKKIRYKKFDQNNPEGVIVLLHGAHETFFKYAEFVYDMKDMPYSVYLMDHRGHGFSERLLNEKADKMHVEKFQYYLDDVKAFYNIVVKPNNFKKKILLAHSMGGGIGTAYLEKYPDDFDKAVLCSPLHMMDTGDMPENIAKLAVGTLSILGLGSRYAPGQGPRVEGTFETNIINHSPARWEIWEQKIMERYPHVHFGGATNSWVNQIINMTRYIRKNAAKLQMPVLLLIAGDDHFVKREGQEEVAQKAANIEKHLYDDAYHELLMEKDEIRDDVLQRIKNFL